MAELGIVNASSSKNHAAFQYPAYFVCSRYENQCQMSESEIFLTSSKFDKLFCTYVHSTGPQLHDLLAIYVTK